MIFDFEDLLSEFEQEELTAKVSIGGYYDYENGGVWVPGAETSTSFTGVVLPLTNEDLQYYEAGTFTTEDRKIYTTTQLTIGQKVQRNGLEYEVKEEKDYSPHIGGYIYFAKRVSEVSA